MKIDNISDNYTEYIIINFEFNLNDIIYKLFDKLSYEDIYCYINCNRLIFNNEANFSNTTFKNEINLYGVLFNKYIDLHMTLFNNESNFSWAIFNNEVDFSNASFDNEVDFSYSTFNNGVCFSEVLFNRAKFLDSNFYYNKNKCKDNINNKINFSHITINYYLELDNTNIQDDTEIIFDNMIFKDNKSYLSIMNIKKEINKLSLKDITIDGRINI